MFLCIDGAVSLQYLFQVVGVRRGSVCAPERNTIRHSLFVETATIRVQIVVVVESLAVKLIFVFVSRLLAFQNITESVEN